MNVPARMKPAPRKLSSEPVFGTENVAVTTGVVGVTVAVWLGSGVRVGVSVTPGVCFGGSVGVVVVEVGVNVAVFVGVLVGV